MVKRWKLSMSEEQVDVWVGKLAKACKESLADSSPSDHMIKIFSLYSELEKLVYENRLERTSTSSNFRVFIWDSDKLNICKKLNAMREKLSYKITELEDKGDFTLDEDFKKHDLGAILAVTFCGVVAARLDSNFTSMEDVCEWHERALGADQSRKDYLIIQVADYYHAFGKCRGDVSDEARFDHLPTKHDLQSLLDRAEEHCESAEKENGHRYINQLRLFIIDAITQLPSYRDELNDYSDLLSLDTFKGERKLISPRVYYSLSKISYAKGDTDRAIEYAVESLQKARPEDTAFVDQCRENLLILEQEKAAKTRIIEDSVKKSVEKAKDELDHMLKLSEEGFSGTITTIGNTIKDDVKAFKEEIDRDIKDAQTNIDRDIKDALLRVIEILGIFLAVAGVIVTQVGGFRMGGSAWQIIGIFTVGYLTIVSLFLILRLIVFGKIMPLRRKDKRAEDSESKELTHISNERKESNDGSQTANRRVRD